VESNLVLWLSIAALAVLTLVLALWLRRRGRGENLADALQSIGIASRTDVTVPDGNGGLIHLEHLIFTAKGVIVLDVKAVNGIVFASDSMEEWTTIATRRRYTFRNPQPALLDRVAAVKLVAKDIPVNGHVVFMSSADFSKGRPSHVIQPKELVERYGKPSHAELERVIEAFSPQWEQLIEICEPSFKLAAN
jgi:hypothetical protein